MLSPSVGSRPFATAGHCLGVLLSSVCVNRRTFLSPPASSAILFSKHESCRSVCMALGDPLSPPALTVYCVFACLQARCATSPTPSSQTCAGTSACMPIVGLRSSAKTVARCSAPLHPSTNTAASVKEKTILPPPQAGSSALAWFSLALQEWTSRPWE